MSSRRATRRPISASRPITARPITARDFGGKLLVLNFWATWCQPCVQEVPSLNQLQRALGPKGVVVLGVSEDKDPKAYQDFLARFHVSYLTARRPGKDIKPKYGTVQIPETYLIDTQRQGRGKDRFGSRLGVGADDRACPVPPLRRCRCASRSAAASAAAKKKIIDLVGPRGYLDRPEDLSLYEYDGSVDKARPELVVFPRTTEEVAAIVKITARARRPDRGPRRRHGPERRRDSAGGRRDRSASRA